VRIRHVVHTAANVLLCGCSCSIHRPTYTPIHTNIQPPKHTLVTLTITSVAQTKTVRQWEEMREGTRSTEHRRGKRRQGDYASLWGLLPCLSGCERTSNKFGARARIRGPALLTEPTLIAQLAAVVRRQR